MSKLNVALIGYGQVAQMLWAKVANDPNEGMTNKQVSLGCGWPLGRNHIGSLSFWGNTRESINI